MISTFTAIIDANVFFGARLRSLILWQAQTGLFRVRWTDMIHDEWMQAVVDTYPDQTIEKLQDTRRAMDDAVDDCLVTGFEGLIESIHLPDKGDRHVVAAAIVAPANVIVTFNLKDFPADELAKFGLHAKHPDDFLLDVAALDPRLFAEAARDDFQHYVRPPLTFDQYLEDLTAAKVPRIAEYLKHYEVIVRPPNDPSIPINK